MSHILEIIARARRADLKPRTFDPVVDVPDTNALLNIPMDPELTALYRATNGFKVQSLLVFGAHGGPYDVIGMNRLSRELRDDVPMLHRVLLCAHFGYQSTELAIVPVHADDRGRYPVVIVDTNEEAFIMPLASTLTRGLELLVDNEIAFARDQGEYEEPFPYSAVQTVRQDTRLLLLIENDAFASIGDEHTLDREWCDLLLGSDDC